MVNRAGLAHLTRFPFRGIAIWYLPALLLLVGITAALYLPGLSGPFLLDDYENLSSMGDYGGVSDLDTLRQYIFTERSGPVGRPLAKLSFLIDARNWPANPYSFKVTNLLIHLLCGMAIAMLGFLIARILRLESRSSARLSLVLAGLWLLHPLNVSTTLYVVQRMTQLMTLFAVLALICYLLGRQLQDTRPRLSLLLLGLCLFPFGLLSVLSKENGALLLLLIPLFEFTVFRGVPRRHLTEWWYRLGVLLPLALFLLLLGFATQDSMASYIIRDFDLVERLLTQTRVLSAYLFKILLPDGNVGSLYHDALPVSSGVLSPPTTLVAMLFLAALLGLAVWMRDRQPILTFAIGWFLALHLLESTWLPLELYFEHRNYLPMVGPLFALVWYFRLLFISPATNSLKVVASLLAAGVLLASVWISFQTVRAWGDQESAYRHMLALSPESMRGRMVFAEYLEFNGRLNEALEQIYIIREYHPREITVQLFLWNFACRNGLELPASITEIASRDDLIHTGDSINYHLEKLLRNVEAQNCPNVDVASLVDLFNKAGEFPNTRERNALFHFYFADVFIQLGRPEAALSELELANTLLPSINTLQRAALVAVITTGELERGLAYLERARAMNSQRPFYLPSLENQIANLEVLLRQLAETTSA